LGATRESILKQFFLETVFVVVLSGAAGLIISYGICGLVNLLPKVPFFDGLDASWKLAALTVSLLGLIAVLSALYPANRAASVDPIEALRFEAGG
jgi:putative ABC transport system permease protein